MSFVYFIVEAMLRYPVHVIMSVLLFMGMRSVPDICILVRFYSPAL